VNDDPYDNEALYQRIQGLENLARHLIAERQYFEGQNTVFQTVAQQEQAFREAHPDYDKAAQHLIEAEQAKFKTMGYSDNEASQYAQREIVCQCLLLCLTSVSGNVPRG